MNKFFYKLLVSDIVFKHHLSSSLFTSLSIFILLFVFIIITRILEVSLNIHIDDNVYTVSAITACTCTLINVVVHDITWKTACKDLKEADSILEDEDE